MCASVSVGAAIVYIDGDKEVQRSEAHWHLGISFAAWSHRAIKKRREASTAQNTKH